MKSCRNDLDVWNAKFRKPLIRRFCFHVAEMSLQKRTPAQVFGKFSPNCRVAMGMGPSRIMVDGKHTIERLQFHSDGRWYTSATFLFGKSLFQHLLKFQTNQIESMILVYLMPGGYVFYNMTHKCLEINAWIMVSGCAVWSGPYI